MQKSKLSFFHSALRVPLVFLHQTGDFHISLSFLSPWGMTLITLMDNILCLEKWLKDLKSLIKSTMQFVMMNTDLIRISGKMRTWHQIIKAQWLESVSLMKVQAFINVTQLSLVGLHGEGLLLTDVLRTWTWGSKIMLIWNGEGSVTLLFFSPLLSFCGSY